MKLSIGSDHAGYAMKSFLKEELQKNGLSIFDKGTFSEESTDYPEYAHSVAMSVESSETELGILICGSANGVAMSANKHAGIRCAICWNEELGVLARSHNDANVLALPARFIDKYTALKIVNVFLNTPFEGGRHARRVNQIAC